MAEIIAALDVPDREAALRWLDQVPELRWVKIGSVLMTNEGGPLVRELVARGLSVFLDLKWHDIPNTVSGAVESARGLGVRMATVHTLGGGEMLRAAAAAAGPDLGIVGVTVLTSLDGTSFGEVIGRGAVDVGAEAMRLARLARGAGLKGVVCSAGEAPLVRPLVGEGGWVVVPGIRRAADRVGDQVRVATPRDAVRAGATHLVVGRPLLGAADPAGVLAAFQEEGA